MMTLTGGSLFLLLKAKLWQISLDVIPKTPELHFLIQNKSNKGKTLINRILERTAVTFSWYLHGKLLFIYLFIFTLHSHIHSVQHDTYWRLNIWYRFTRSSNQILTHLIIVKWLLYINMHMLSECGNYFRILTRNSPILICEGLAF